VRGCWCPHPLLGRTRLAWLGTGLTSSAPAAVKGELEKLAYLRGMDAHALDLSVLPAERGRFLAGLGRRLKAQNLARRDDDRKYPILLTLAAQSAVDVVDEVLLLFEQALTGREAAARERLTQAPRYSSSPSSSLALSASSLGSPGRELAAPVPDSRSWNSRSTSRSMISSSMVISSGSALRGGRTSLRGRPGCSPRCAGLPRRAGTAAAGWCSWGSGGAWQGQRAIGRLYADPGPADDFAVWESSALTPKGAAQ
jgi:hypothetical protein